MNPHTHTRRAAARGEVTWRRACASSVATCSTTLSAVQSPPSGRFPVATDFMMAAILLRRSRFCLPISCPTDLRGDAVERMRG